MALVVPRAFHMGYAVLCDVIDVPTVRSPATPRTILEWIDGSSEAIEFRQDS
jgi:hypothetical protein